MLATVSFNNIDNAILCSPSLFSRARKSWWPMMCCLWACEYSMTRLNSGNTVDDDYDDHDDDEVGHSFSFQHTKICTNLDKIICQYIRSLVSTSCTVCGDLSFLTLAIICAFLRFINVTRLYSVPCMNSSKNQRIVPNVNSLYASTVQFVSFLFPMIYANIEIGPFSQLSSW